MAMATRSWAGLLNRLVTRVDLAEDDTSWAMNEIMSGNATPAQVGAFAVALRAKGETSAEVAGMAAAMLAHARRVELDRPSVDVVGTGGEPSGAGSTTPMSALLGCAAPGARA